MHKKYPTIDRLRQMFCYDPDGGDIFWIEKGKGKIKKQAAGTTELSGYRGILIDGKRIRSHRIAWALFYGEWPEDQIDHVNGVKSDNRIANLRKASNSQNGKNLSIKKNNTSGYPGVSFDKANNKWRAMIKVNYKSIHLGRFTELSDAIAAKKDAEIKYYGEWRHYK